MPCIKPELSDYFILGNGGFRIASHSFLCNRRPNMFVASSTWLCGYKGPAWRNTVPILRQLLAFSLAWLLIFGDLPAQAAMATTAAPVPKELSRSLRSSKDDYRNFDYELTAFPQQSGAPTIPSISPDNVPAGQTI